MIKKFLALSLAAATLSGCSVFSLDTQEVNINSAPAGADVYIGGELVGVTPLDIRLDKSISHNVVIRKAGYNDLAYTIGTQTLNPFIKFGPFVDAGFYHELVPNPSGGNLKPNFLPAVVGLDQFNEMMDAILTANAKMAEGKIDASEHTYLLNSIAEFYAPGVREEISSNDTSAYNKMSNEVGDLEDLKADGKVSDSEYKRRMDAIIQKYSIENK